MASLNDFVRDLHAPHSRPFAPQLSELFRVLVSKKNVLEGKPVLEEVKGKVTECPVHKE